MTPEVSIIIPTVNHLEACVKPCIESIISFTDLSRVEIIVVCNGCNDGTEAYLASLNEPSIRFISTRERQGAPTANNMGIKIARADLILLLNDDIVILPSNRHDWVNRLMTPFADAQIGVCGLTKLWDGNTKYEFVISFCMMVRKSLFEQVGYLDPAFTVGDEVDFCIKAQKAGYKLAMVGEENEYLDIHYNYPLWHKAGQTLPFLPRQDNEAILKQRYQVPPTYTIIVTLPDEPQEVKRCVKSIWKYTRFNDCEIVYLYKSEPETEEYLKLIYERGPYKFFPKEIGLPVDAIEGEYVVCLDGKVHFSHQEKSEWIDKLVVPLKLEPKTVAGTNYCFMIRKDQFTDETTLITVSVELPIYVK